MRWDIRRTCALEMFAARLQVPKLVVLLLLIIIINTIIIIVIISVVIRLGSLRLARGPARSLPKRPRARAGLWGRGKLFMFR